MPEVIFKFDKEKDLKNLWETANFENKCFDKKWISSTLIKLAYGKSFEECKDKLEKHYFKVHNSFLIKDITEYVNNSWGKINDEFFKRLEKIMKHKIVFNEIKGYLTTTSRCPYNPNLDNPYFYFGGFNGVFNILKTAGHEIMHIQFHNIYWKEIEKEIGYEKTWDLKESLTVLLNLEFNDLWFVEDKGYGVHKDLRKFIEEEWKKKKDFDVLMKKCVKYLKEVPAKDLWIE